MTEEEKTEKQKLVKMLKAQANSLRGTKKSGQASAKDAEARKIQAQIDAG